VVVVVVVVLVVVVVVVVVAPPVPVVVLVVLVVVAPPVPVVVLVVLVALVAPPVPVVVLVVLVALVLEQAPTRRAGASVVRSAMEDKRKSRDRGSMVLVTELTTPSSWWVEMLSGPRDDGRRPSIVSRSRCLHRRSGPNL
jgi:hypothetical protein